METRTRRRWRALALAAVTLAAGYLASQAIGSARADQIDYGPLQEDIRRFVETRPQRFGIYFKDLTSEQEWGMDADRPIQAASTVKVPIALLVNQLVADGKLRWTDRIRYVEALDYGTGAGVLQFQGMDGSTYSLRVLTNLMITVSDNVAWHMLTRFLGKDNIAAYMRRLGGRTVFPDGANVSTARDMGVYVQAVLDLRERQPELGDRLIDDLSHTIWHVGLPGKLPPTVRVAHKEGDVTGVADDVGIVFSRRPFILAIMSDGVDDIEAGFADIAHISRLVYDFQEQLATHP